MPPNQVLFNNFVLGMIVMSSAAAGLFFLRFWRKTHDRLFAIFAIAFWLLGVNWLTLAFINQNEVRTWLYTIRLAAFILILIGIIDKNRPRRP
jgi:hypothetical protein